MKLFLRAGLCIGFSFCAAAPMLQAATPSVSVVSLTKVSETRVNRTDSDFVFKVTLQNGFAAATNVSETLMAAGSGTTIIDGSVLAGNLAANQTITPEDTITLRQNRLLAFDQSKLVWQTGGNLVVSSTSSSIPSSAPASTSSSVPAASSSSASSYAGNVFESANGWASYGTNNLGAAGTTGGAAADVAHIFTVRNRNELLRALYGSTVVIKSNGSFSGTLDNTPKMIYVDGTISLNVNSDLVEQTESDYICPIDGATIKVAYDFNDYKTTYDPNGSWGSSSLPSGDLEAARVCAAAKQKAVVKFKVGSNTSIIGLNKNAKIIHGNLSLAPGNDNIIIRNITFEDSFDFFPQWDPTDSGGRWNSAYDNISVEGATHVWIDHVSVNDGVRHDKLFPPVYATPFNIPEMKVQHHDGAIDVTKGSNYVTLSYNYIHDHDKTHLVGSSDTVAADNGPQFLKITLHHNLFENVTQRLPRVRMGQVHIYNNYYVGQVKPTDAGREYGFSTGMATGQFGKIFAENNSFTIAPSSTGIEPTISQLHTVSFKADTSTINKCTAVSGNTASDCQTLFYENGAVLNNVAVNLMTAAQNAAASNNVVLGDASQFWNPINFYPYTLDSAPSVEVSVMANAGAGNCMACSNFSSASSAANSSASSVAVSSVQNTSTASSTTNSASSSTVTSSSSSSASSIAFNCGASIYACDDFESGSGLWDLKPVGGPDGTFAIASEASGNHVLGYTAASVGGVLATSKTGFMAAVPSADYYVEARIRPMTNSTTGNKFLSLLGRYQDANNWYAIDLNVQSSTASTQVEIHKMVAGTLTRLKQTKKAIAMDAQFYTVRLEMQGSNLTVYLDGEKISTIADTSITAKGLMGLYTANKSFQIDDVKIGDANTKPVQLTLTPYSTNWSAEAGDAPYVTSVTAVSSDGVTADTFSVQSSDTNVVSVAINGTSVSLTPIAAGTATITFTSGSDSKITRSIAATIAPQFVQPTTVYNTSNNLLPSAGETAAYVDGNLQITFDSTPTLGSGGSIRIFKKSDDTLVDTILLSGNVDALGYSGQANLRMVNSQPLRINGNTLTIVPHNSKLAYGTEYYVAIANGVVTGTSFNGTPFSGIGKAGNWSFTTKATAPSGTNLVVDDNGPADFRSLQGALNFVMQTVAKATSTTITIKNGSYEELLYLRGKDNLTIQGESRDGVVIYYKNSEAINSGSGASQTAGSPAGGRSVFLAETSDMLVLDNLTLKNTTLRSAAASQAEVIYFNNDAGRLIATNSNFFSEQDTLQLKGYNWFYNSLVAGNVDFIWGASHVALFENSEIRSVGDTTNASSGGYVLQARVASASDKGFVFLNSKLTHGAGPGPLAGDVPNGATYLARSGGSATYFDNIVFVNTRMDSHVAARGWAGAGVNSQPAPNPATATATSGWREYGSMDLNGNPLDVSSRQDGYLLSASDVANNFATRALIFSAYNSGAGWNPEPPANSMSSVSSSSVANSQASSSSSNSSVSSSASSAMTSSIVSSSSTSSVNSSASSSSSTAAVVTRSWGFNSDAYAAADTALFMASYNPVGDNGIKITGGEVSVDGLLFNSTATNVIRYRPAGSSNNTSANAIWNTNGSFFTSNSVMVPAIGGDLVSVRTYLAIPVASGMAFTITISYKQTSASATAGKIALAGSDNKILAFKDASISTAAVTGDTISLTVPAGHSYSSVKIIYGREAVSSGGVNISAMELVQ